MPVYISDLQTYDGYDTPDDHPSYSINMYFYIEGYSIQSRKGFIIFERGIGNDYTTALDNAYSKIHNRLAIRYKIITTTMKVIEYYDLEHADKKERSGFSFYSLDDLTIEKIKEGEERYYMSLEDK